MDHVGEKITIQKSRRVKTLTGFLIYPSSLKSNQTWLNTKIKDQLTYNYFISVNVKDSFRKGNSLFVLRREFFCEHPCYFEIIEFNKMKRTLTSDYVEKYIVSYKQFTTIFILYTVSLGTSTRYFLKRWIQNRLMVFFIKKNLEKFFDRQWAGNTKKYSAHRTNMNQDNMLMLSAFALY